MKKERAMNDLIRVYGQKLPEQLLSEINLGKGGHADRASGVCAMEAAAWLAGREHSDHPPCVSPVIAGFVINWNDNLPSDDERNRILRPVLPLILGTAGEREAENRRSWMAADWLIREFAPAFLALHPQTAGHAVALRTCGEIGAPAALEAARPVLAAAGAAARDAAGAAAWDAAGAAAWYAAWDAAKDAAGDAAWAAAWDAAGAAARDAAWAAAWYAARAAARDAAGAAARTFLAPTVSQLQDSALELLKRMARVGREEAGHAS
jgi:hypothetical protein